MRFDLKQAAGVYVALLAVQILSPAFLPMNAGQQGAVALFCQSVATVLGLRALFTNPDGTPAAVAYRPPQNGEPK